MHAASASLTIFLRAFRTSSPKARPLFPRAMIRGERTGLWAGSDFRFRTPERSKSAHGPATRNAHSPVQWPPIACSRALYVHCKGE
jgi:hypothetical protein